MRWIEDPDESGPSSFVTDTGCTVRVVPDWDATKGQWTGNTRLILRMEQPDDGRWAEVMLTTAECRALRLLLERRSA